MKAILINKLTSRKLWLGILGLVIAVISDPAGLDLTNQAQTALAASPIVSIIALAIEDTIKALKAGGTQ